jgi:hypothetical protein
MPQPSSQDIPSERLLAICHSAGELFLSGRVPVGDAGQEQTAEDYVRQASASCGLPHALVRNNMGKIAHVLLEMHSILKGLTRGLDLTVLDAGMGEQQGVPVSFYRTADSLGVVLPSNSPGSIRCGYPRSRSRCRSPSSRDAMIPGRPIASPSR